MWLVGLGLIFIFYEDMLQHAIDMETAHETYEVICDSVILATVATKLLLVVCGTQLSFGN